MGCGAICGDSVAEAGSTTVTVIRTMQALLPLLNKTSFLLSKQTYRTFLNMYHQDPKRFHLFPKKHILKDEPFPEEVLLRWKLVLFGLDSDLKQYCECLGLVEEAEAPASSGIIPIQSNMQSTVIYHECFAQIQKDLDRTFSLSEGRKRDFENVLKRIANFFPKMGYTQGINFVIGFLIIIGYSENDTFWIFVHIALNRRYLLLGLYEDGFPLCNVFCLVFKNVLKRTNQPLYLHVFQILTADISMWVFKWFMTCFTYSFPLEMAKYAWEIMIQLGALGIVSLAISLTDELGPFLLQKDDMCEFSEFMKKLDQVEVFNHFVNMERVMKRSYDIEILPTDFDGVESSGGFYGEYLRNNCNFLQSHLRKEPGLPKFSQISEQSQSLLNQWYRSLLADRLNFHDGRKKLSSQELHLGIESTQKIQKNESEEDIEVVLFGKQEESTAPEGKMNLEIILPQVSSRRNQTECYSYRVSYPIDRINQRLQEESRSAKSRQSSKRVAEEAPSRKSSSIVDLNDLEELDKLQMEVYNKAKKDVKINNYAVPQSKKNPGMKKNKEARPIGRLSKPESSNHSHKIAMRTSNTFTMTGQNVLNIENYDAISVSSRNTSQKERVKTNQHGPVEPKGRSCACKTKTEENKFSSIDKNSEVASSKGQFSDKDSVSNSVIKGNMSHSEENVADINTFSMQNVDTFRDRLDRVQSNDNYMICSQGPAPRETQSRGAREDPVPKERLDIEVEVLPFKKDKRKKESKVTQIEKGRREGTLRTGGVVEPSEESLDSIVGFSFEQTTNCKRQNKSEAIGGCACEIESVR